MDVRKIYVIKDRTSGLYMGKSGLNTLYPLNNATIFLDGNQNKQIRSWKRSIIGEIASNKQFILTPFKLYDDQDIEKNIEYCKNKIKYLSELDFYAVEVEIKEKNT